MNTSVDAYFVDGCGRCALGGTPACKVHTWENELRELRRIVLDCGLDEQAKWGAPCYSFKNGNVLMIAAFKESCVLSFFKGVLLQDADGLLEKPGENSQAGRFFRFTDVKKILTLEPVIKAYIFEAIEVERAGMKVEFKKNPEPMPDELVTKLESDPILKNAFESLTPGRQRGYIIHFSQPKQSKTRESRIEKCVPKIMEGKGFHDR